MQVVYIVPMQGLHNPSMYSTANEHIFGNWQYCPSLAHLTAIGLKNSIKLHCILYYYAFFFKSCLVFTVSRELKYQITLVILYQY